MGITMLTLSTGLMLTCETSKCKVEICNFDNLFFNQNNSGVTMNKLCCYTCIE